ncbi:MAG: NAD-dependent epimerase/dehydratase family protein [Planctomycetales bacterium]|nr:NAD-dependent epimerase/dehydratase family protein [Planctomycetales bacterium]
MIFVTGGTGLLGNTVIRELLHRGERVAALCRPETSREAFDGLALNLVEGDLSGRSALSAAVADCSAVIHCAAMIHIGWTRLDASRRVNVEGTRVLAELCVEHSKRLVHVSTVDTLPAAVDLANPITEAGEGGIAKTPCAYVVSKSEAEEVVRNYVSERGLDAVILHPGFMLGPNDWKPSSGRMLLEVAKAPMLFLPSGGCSVCDARDVAHSTVEAIQLGQSGENYILAGRNLSYAEFWRMIRQQAGKSWRAMRVGPGIRGAMSAFDFAVRTLHLPEGDVNGATLAMGNLNHYYTSDKATQALGYSIRELETSLADAWNWLQNRQ